MYNIYVSAQVDTKLDTGMNLARVINALTFPNDKTFPHFANIVTGKGVWNGVSEPVVILSVGGGYPVDHITDCAEYLRYWLDQESVMVVSDSPIVDWDPVYRAERNIDSDNCTVRDGMGQRPYSYMAITHPEIQPAPTHWVHFANRH